MVFEVNSQKAASNSGIFEKQSLKPAECNQLYSLKIDYSKLVHTLQSKPLQPWHQIKTHFYWLLM